MKIFEKMLIVFILIFCIFLSYSFVSAHVIPTPDGGTGGSQGAAGGTQVNPDNYKPSDSSTADTTPLLKIGGFLLSLIRNIGVIISVVVIAIVGLKYMVGSIDEKAKYKETFFPIIVGAVLLMGSSIFAQVIYSVITK